MFPEYWDILDRFVAESRVVIDRPQGAPHPRFPEMIYPLDYGYLDGTHTIDGGGIDLFRGSQAEMRLDGVALTVDPVKRDAEVKLLLGCTSEDTRTVLEFLNGVGMGACLVRRDGELEWLRSRRSVRRFQSKPVSRPLLERLIETSAWAPSAHHRQPWRFVVLTGVEAKARLADTMAEDFERDLRSDALETEAVQAQVERSRERIGLAPALVLLCLDISDEDVYPDAARQEAERLMGVQSAALAGGQLLLAAHAVGLGAVWMCAPLFAPRTISNLLHLPETWKPQALILLGYPAKIPAARPRKRLDEIAIFFE